MHYRRLGRSSLKVSPICLGTMMFGGRTGSRDALDIIAEAADHGVNFIDTADVYNGGQSERIVGRGLSANRDHWVVATKAANRTGPGPNDRGTGRRHLMAACEASLRRLGTDAIDIFYLHREDPDTPLEETVRALADLVRQGKIRYFGLSNYRAWRIATVAHLADQAGIDRPVVLQPYYNALNRMPEVEVLPAARHYGLGVAPYSPLARGVLTAKYRPEAPPPADSRAARQDTRMMQTEWRPESLIIAEQVQAHATARGLTAGQFAVAWLLANPIVTSVIAGPRTAAQWRDYQGGVDYAWTAEDEALIDRLVPPGHPSTPGYTDPAYPLEGRPRPD